MAVSGIKEVNEMNEEDFLNTFKNVVELFPDAAKNVRKDRPFNSLVEMINIFDLYLENLDNSTKLRILQLHPDLAGQLADENKLTEESLKEQTSAGLNMLPAADKQKMNDLNSSYKTKFDFPFVICARENKVESILKGLQDRLNNSREQELTTGINEVKKICKLRILQIVTK